MRYSVAVADRLHFGRAAMGGISRSRCSAGRSARSDRISAPHCSPGIAGSPRRSAPRATKLLTFGGPRGGHVWRTSLNEDHREPALAKVGVIPGTPSVARSGLRILGAEGPQRAQTMKTPLSRAVCAVQGRARKRYLFLPYFFLPWVLSGILVSWVFAAQGGCSVRLSGRHWSSLVPVEQPRTPRGGPAMEYMGCVSRRKRPATPW